MQTIFTKRTADEQESSRLSHAGPSPGQPDNAAREPQFHKARGGQDQPSPFPGYSA